MSMKAGGGREGKTPVAPAFVQRAGKVRIVKINYLRRYILIRTLYGV